jgi:hypothetical protein
MPRATSAIAVVLLLLSWSIAARANTTPTLTGTATGGGPIDGAGATLQDDVVLSGTEAGTGIITFSLFGAEDPACEGNPLSSSATAVHGDGEYASSEYFPTRLGAYHYVASYSGDTENGSASTVCGTAGQSATVTSAVPKLLSVASSSASVGEGISDTARFVGGYEPTGTITFDLFGPGDITCGPPPIAMFVMPVGEESRFTSPIYTALAEGEYLWVASYSGDSRNLPVQGTCGEEGESVLVAPIHKPATLHVHASAVGGESPQVTATATLEGARSAGGLLTFREYGPNDPNCQYGAVSASTRPVAGDGEYTSDPFDPSSPGSYQVVASFTGADGLTAETVCGEAGSAVEVRGPSPPVLDRSITIERVSGTVLVQVGAAAAGNGAATSSVGFIEVRGQRSIPVGTVVETKAGMAKLTAASARKQLQSGVFAGSRFVVRQRASDRGTVELDLRSSARARGSCAPTSHRASIATRRKLPPKLLAELRAEVKGHFRTTGTYSSASAHGTSWETVERCDGTLTRVLSDAVTVRDFRRHRSFLVQSGHSYLARASG